MSEKISQSFNLIKLRIVDSNYYVKISGIYSMKNSIPGFFT